MLQDLPDELHELIISHLDKRSASNYSLTCSRFTYLAQKPLFETIDICLERSSSLDKNRYADFETILTSSPHLGGLIKSLVLRGTGWWFGSQKHGTTLPRCFPLLRNLENFGLHGIGGVEKDLWTHLSDTLPATAKAVEEICRTQDLVYLSIHNYYDVPFSLLRDLTSLQKLSLYDVDFEKRDTPGLWDDYQESPRAGKCCKLKMLKLGLESAVLRFFLTWLARPSCPLDISQLRRLSITNISERYHHAKYDFPQDDVRSTLRACADSLEILCLAPGNINVPIMLDIGMHPQLRVLRLYVSDASDLSFGYLAKTFHYIYRWLDDVLSSITLPIRLEELSIKMSPVPSRRRKPDLPAWEPVKALISRNVASIDSVVFFFVLPWGPPLDLDMDQFMNDAFPMLRESGILKARSTNIKDGFLVGEDVTFPSYIC